MQENKATGEVISAFGNLLHVKFSGVIRQGEVLFIEVGGERLKGEVIEIAGQIAKVQVFEEMRGIKAKSPASFTSYLLEAELGPGLITTIFDGLQNPLEEVANHAGLFLPRGLYLNPLDRTKGWEYEPVANVGDSLKRGGVIGKTMEGRFAHKIMLPFSFTGEWKVTWIIAPGLYTIDTVVAKVTKEGGEEREVTMVQKWPIKLPLMEGRKVKATEMMDTGLRLIDTQFPVVKGGAFCSPGPFGAGKTVLQNHLAKYSSVDIVVLVACGERAGEVVEVLRTFPHLIDHRTEEPLINRTVIICNTSSMPVSAREASIYMGVTIAEYFRQMGLDVLLIADSTSRWAQAMREMSGRLEEIPGEEAFPAYLASRIASFYERSGVLKLPSGEKGSLTIGGTVSPAGGNFEEPVTQATLAVVGAFLALSRDRSNARRYPAIDPLISWSKYLDEVGSELESKLPSWQKKVEKAREILQLGDEIAKRMEVVGEEGVSIEDITTYLKGELYEFVYLQQNAFDEEDAYCSIERQLELFLLIDAIFDLKIPFDSQDEARGFFMNLQSHLKNMNSLSFHSESYKNAYDKAKEKIEHASRYKKMDQGERV